MTTLKTTRHHEGQEIEIFVKYDPKENVVEEIKSVNLRTHGHCYPVGNFFMAIHQLADAVNAIVDDTDWRAVYRGLTDEKEIDNYLDSVPVDVGPVPVQEDHTLLPVFADIFKPYLK